MKWMAPEPWQALKHGKACPMCADIHLAENPHSFKVCELSQSLVRLPRNQYMRGWTLVILKRHAAELFELSPDELHGFWDDVTLVAHALDRLYAPAKINYLIFGHQCPHLHCHLLVHGYDADPHKPVKMDEQEVLLKHEEYHELVQALRAAIVQNSPSSVKL